MGGKTCNTVIERYFAAINVENQVAHFSFPVLPYLYTSDRCKSDKNTTIHEPTLKLYRLQRIVKVYPFKDSFNVLLLNVGSSNTGYNRV